MSELNILQNVKPANIVMTPYPHVVVEGALPEKLFNELARTYPSMRYVARDEENLNNKATLRELEILRAVCEALGCPMPPLQVTLQAAV